MFQINKCLVFGAILLLVLGHGLSLTGQCTKVENLDTSECFDTIQAAIDDGDTDAGDTIKVLSGTYAEQVTIDKSITLEGSSRWSTRIEYGSSPGVIVVTADDVIIKNVGVFWTGSFSFNYSGIKIESDDCLVDNVIVANGKRNVYFYSGTSGNTLSNSIIATDIVDHESVTVMGTQNVVCGNLIISADDLGFGIVVAGTQNDIIGNTISGHEFGIYLVGAQNNDIYYNNFLDNDTHASTFMTSPNYNQWDDGGTYGGNYWGSCTDSDCDGFCDSSYTIDTGEVDDYPLANLSTLKCQ